MIFGVGTDIVEYARVQAIWDRFGEHFANRILMEEETEQHDQSIVMELYFGSVEKAVESWKKVQQLPNYELVVGTILFKE